MADYPDISRGPSLRDYLAGKPDQWAWGIAVRAALRVFPLALQEASEPADIRPFFIAWAGLIYPDVQNLIHSPGVATSIVSDAASAAVAAVAALARSGEAARGYAGMAAALAARAAATVLDEARDMVWASVSADIRWLNGENAEGLIEKPLWLIDVRSEGRYQANFPVWARKPFDEFNNSEIGRSDDWQHWTEWYRAILPHNRNAKPRSSFDKQTVIDLVKTGPRRPDISRRAARPAGSAALPGKAPSRVRKSADIRPVKPKKARTLESVEPKSDEPTSVDQLGRRPFAQALVERLDKIHEKEGSDGFAVHIYAPWGAGKTSILKMMRELMIDRTRKSADGKPARQWVVVQFNAWEQERRDPPWWPLVEAVKGECLQHLSGSAGGLHFFSTFLKRLWLEGYLVDWKPLWFQGRWMLWKIKSDLLPYVVLSVVAVASVWLIRHSGDEWVLKVITASIAAFASFFAASRIAVFGSVNNAKFYEDISQDPLKRITALFRTIIEKTGKPVCIFIDDLDRCSGDYVVDLLQGIQTSFRHKNVAYVVAADRNWLRNSFEMRYGSFSGAVGNAGQPLGYLFLEKIFQVSTPVPGMGDRIRSEYWDQLLKAGVEQQRTAGMTAGQPPSAYANKEFDKKVEIERADIRKKLGENITNEEAATILETTDSEEVRAAVVLELNASPAADKQAKHLLGRFVDVVPDNPRVMKRMINAFAMRRAIDMLERNDIPVEVLVRWTILDQRFPALAEMLVENSEWIQILSGNTGAGNSKELPQSLLPFADSEIVRKIIGSRDDHPLTADRVRTITRGSAT